MHPYFFKYIYTRKWFFKKWEFTATSQSRVKLVSNINDNLCGEVEEVELITGLEITLLQENPLYKNKGNVFDANNVK